MRARKGWIWLLPAGLLGLLLILMALLVRRKQKERDSLKNRRLIRNSDYAALEAYIFAMARHETNDFKSQLYQRANNMFGFKTRSENEPGTPAPDGGRYRIYRNDGQSVIALLDWFDRKNFPYEFKSLGEFVHALKVRKFFTDTEENYLKGAQRFFYEGTI